MRSTSEFIRDFPTDHDCILFLFHKRFPYPICDHCGRKGPQFFRYIPSAELFLCHCRETRIIPTKDTIFHTRSRVSIRDWFHTLFLLSQSPDLSLQDIQREVSITYKDAKIMLPLIKMLLKREPDFLYAAAPSSSDRLN